MIPMGGASISEGIKKVGEEIKKQAEKVKESISDIDGDKKIKDKLGNWADRIDSTEDKLSDPEERKSDEDGNFELGDWGKSVKDDTEFKASDVKEKHDVQTMQTKNQALEGQRHPETGVPFVRKEVENSEGEKVEVVVPEFESEFDAQLPDELLEATDKEQFDECNRQLKETIENDPELITKFTDEQLDQILNGETPDGYTWHHDAEKGKMQLVDTKTHSQTGHTGGKAIWGGGTENR